MATTIFMRWFPFPLAPASAGRFDLIGATGKSGYVQRTLNKLRASFRIQPEMLDYPPPTHQGRRVRGGPPAGPAYILIELRVSLSFDCLIRNLMTKKYASL
jgi:hypothetical protein